jgi:hypothetical protein
MTAAVAQLKRWPAIMLSVILILLAALWIDSYSHERHFIFILGGDVGLGFATDRGRLHWVEYAPWSTDPRAVYWSKGSVPFFFAAALGGIALICYVSQRRNNEAEQPDGAGNSHRAGQ